MCSIVSFRGSPIDPTCILVSCISNLPNSPGHFVFAEIGRSRCPKMAQSLRDVSGHALGVIIAALRAWNGYAYDVSFRSVESAFTYHTSHSPLSMCKLARGAAQIYVEFVYALFVSLVPCI